MAGTIPGSSDWAWAGRERAEALLARIKSLSDRRPGILATGVGDLALANPVLTASGTYGFGREYAPLVPPAALGAITTKCVTLEVRQGNPSPRVTETPAGMLNSIGLQNPGVDEFLRSELPWLRESNATVVVNIAAATVSDYARLTARLADAEGIGGLEINVSCPNVEREGMAFGVSPTATAAVIAAVRRETSLPVICKLTPNVTDIAEIAMAAEAAGADAISLINTLLGMVIDVETRRPVIANTFAGLSGPAIRPVAVRMVWQVRQAVRVPVIGMGGIASATDALEFILAGASAVAVGSACFANPLLPLEVIAGIGEYLERCNLTLTEAVGLAHKR
jgi:dihydroorotate dehydrogenase (NAD+) catalytic subunit